MAALLSLAFASSAAAGDYIAWYPAPPALVEAARTGDFAAAQGIAIAATGECLERPDWSPEAPPAFAIACAGPFLELFAFAAEANQARTADLSARTVYELSTGDRATGDRLQVLKSAADEIGRNEEYLRSVPFYDYWAERKVSTEGGEARREIAALALAHARSQLYATAAVLFGRILFDGDAPASGIEPAWSRAFTRALIRSQRSDTAIEFLDAGRHGLGAGTEDKLRGWALMQQGRYDEADDSLRRAFASGEADRETDLLLGRLLRLQGRLDEALPILARLVSADRAVIEDEAAADALSDEAWYAINVRLARALGEFGLAVLASGDADTARRELAESYARSTIVGEFYPPDGAEYFAGQGDAELARGDCDAAVSSYSRALEIDFIFKGADYPLVPVREIMRQLCQPRDEASGARTDADYAAAWRKIAATWDERHPQRIAIAQKLGEYYLARASRPRLSHAFFADAAAGARENLVGESGSAEAILRIRARYRPVFIGQVRAAWQVGRTAP